MQKRNARRTSIIKEYTGKTQNGDRSYAIAVKY